MAMTDPKLFAFSPDTAHLHLGGSDVVGMFEKYKNRLMFMDYKDARWTTPTADVHLDNGRMLPTRIRPRRNSFPAFTISATATSIFPAAIAS